MLKHIVMWKFKDAFAGKTKEELMEEQRAALLALPAKIDLIRGMEVGKDTVHGANSFDMALVSEFDSRDDMLAYRAHPDHVAVSKRMKEYVTDRVCIDFEI